MSTDAITLQHGQAVPWPHSPGGVAQVDELRRTKVRIVYCTKRGTWRFRLVDVDQIRELLHGPEQQQLIPMRNPFNRACLSRSKAYTPRSQS